MPIVHRAEPLQIGRCASRDHQAGALRMTTPIADILLAMPGKRILVVGDVMLDRFIYGRTQRVSPEAPSLVLAADRQEQMLGGAANADVNILAPGGFCHP